MTRDEFMRRIELIATNCVEICRKKNSDYAASSDAFANFRAAAQEAGISVEQVIRARMGEKNKRMLNLLNQPNQVEHETILDTLDDMANFAMILRVWLEVQREASSD